ncbi:MAG: histidinol-phosphate transaminase [Phycisphaerales bacterium]
MQNPVPANRIGKMKPYQPPSVGSEVLVRLDANEGPVCEQSTLNVLASITPDQVNRYPDASPLEQMIAQIHDVDPRCVVVTNGADDAIDRVVRAVVEQGTNAVLHTPTFEMINRSVKLCGGKLISTPWIDWDFPLTSMLDSINKDTKLVSVVTPNNPTGRSVSPGDIRAIAQRAGDVGAVVMVDQAYGEFDQIDPYETLKESKNIVFLRTFSKSMGLAGIRVGYAIAPVEIADWMRTVGGPYPVSSISLAIAASALELVSTRANLIDTVKRNRQVLINQLITLGAKPIESNANFVLVQFDDALSMHTSLLKMGISVRKYNPGSVLKDYLRITVPADADQFKLLSTSIDSILPNVPKNTREQPKAPAESTQTSSGALS